MCLRLLSSNWETNLTNVRKELSHRVNNYFKLRENKILIKISVKFVVASRSPKARATIMQDHNSILRAN